MQPHMPMLRGAGQAEVQATWLPASRFDAGTAYSPLRYMVLTAVGSLRPRGGYDTTYFYSRQYEVGVGTYLPATDRLLLSGLLGGGHAVGERGFREPDLFFNPTDEVAVYRARYYKLFGQLGVAYEWDRVMLGATYRLTNVTFTTLTYNGQPLPIQQMLRGEPMLFLRSNDRKSQRPGWAQLQMTLGVSAGLSQQVSSRGYNDERIRNSAFTAGVGVVFYPHRFGAKRREAK
ncbi:hypothetical protein KBK19_12655 [Microvirga sp. STR05]|uniref:Outer membrane protein beta-barrel domain-containing protein n=1 Tax=Hymenobacter duratus TaxID=2771356 RepID=A0ABR8JII9_9BACT|nr:hypothetical protein [Hymenobacter duratus]MBD2715887.1 hypothetical protein [Hymenobacter duratus]MBR7950799.1 hypothetical protein [Microvirga sp. STR05]